MQQELLSDLEKLGLTQNQAVIYLALIEHGPVRIQTLCNYTQLPRTSVYAAIEKLNENNLTDEIVENGYKLFSAQTIARLKARTKTQIEEAQFAEMLINRLAQRLPVQNKSIQTLTAIKRYKHSSGARQVFWNTLKASDEIYVYSSWGRSKFVGVPFYTNFVSESTKRKINEKVLVTSNPSLKDRILREAESPTSRTLTENIWQLPIKINGETFIYNDIYAQIYLKNNIIHGFEIQNQEFVETQRSIFENLLKIALPIK